MNEKINLQDLIDLLQKQQKMEQIDADAFIRAFWETIEEGLLNDGIVKVKGLGTFKLVGVESRESINVNTGERFEIQQHSKITFMADSSMRNIINKPFAHFESVILNEKTVFDDIEENVIGEPDFETQQSGETTDEDLSITGTQVASMPGLDTSNDRGAEQPVSHGSACIEVSRKDDERLSCGGEGDSTQNPMAPKELADETKDSLSIEELDKMPISEKQMSACPEEGLIDEDKTLLAKVDSEVSPEKTEGNGIVEEEAAVKFGEEELAGYTSSSEQDETDSAIDVSTDSLEKVQGQEMEPDKELVMSEQQHTCSKPMDMSRQDQVSDECVLTPSKPRNRTMLFSFITAVLFIVMTGYLVLFYSRKDKQNNGVQKETQRVENVNPENNSGEKPLTLCDSDSIEVSVSSVPKISKQKLSVVSSVKNTDSDVKEKNIESGKTKQKLESEKTRPGQVVLTTRVKGQETLADTVEYDIVGVLGQEQIRPGDTLAKFAFKYYGNRRLWQYIAVYNKSVVKNPNNVPIGTILKIPKLELKQ